MSAVHPLRILPAIPALCLALNAAEVDLHGHRFTLPDGFTIERAVGPDLAPRPVSASFDEDGHLYVTDSDGSNEPPAEQLKHPGGRILRLEDRDGDGIFDHSVVYADRVMFPQGCLWHRGWVYVAAPPSIWRFRDADGDGVAEQREEWFRGGTLTGCANDIHGPYAGPDGFIYWTKGAFAEQTHPLADGSELKDRAAHILRMRPDGSGLSVVMTGGMDNPVEVDFTREGQALFTSTFIDFTQPGFRDGVAHARYGAVFGKQNDVLLDARIPHADTELAHPFVQLGAAAPSGLCRYPEGAFGPGWRDNFFATSFNLHKVTRHVLRPDGATFAADTTDFVVSDQVDFHPTDVLPDADGSLLIVDTGGWYKLCCPSSQLAKADVLGAIYRVRKADAPRPADPRGQRYSWTEATLDALVGRARKGSEALRERCLDRLSRRGQEGALRLADLVLEAGDPDLRQTALWCLARSTDPVARRTVDKLLDDENRSLARTAARIVALDPAPTAGDGRLRRLHAAWHEAAGENDAARLLSLAESLARLRDTGSVPALLEALATTRPGDALGVGLTRALIDIGDAPSTRAGLASAAPSVRRAALLALDRIGTDLLQPVAVAAVLTEPDPDLRGVAGWILGRHPEWSEALAQWFGTRLGDAAIPVEIRTALESRLDILANSTAGQDLLAVWIESPDTGPSTRTAALRAIAGNGGRTTPPSWVRSLGACLSNKPDAGVVAATRRHASNPDLAGALIAVGRREDLPRNLREAAYAALPSGWTATNSDVAFLAGSDVDGPTREAAVALARARLESVQRGVVADRLAIANPLALLALLPAFESGGDDPLGERVVSALGRARSRASLRPGSVRSTLSKFPEKTRSAAEALARSLDTDAATQAAHLEKLLTEITALDGDVRRGQAVFLGEKAACLTCHQIGYQGGKVGPDLTRIGEARTARDLLESIVYPSASFVRSYEPMLVTTRDGEEINGILRGESDREIALVQGPGPEIRIPRESVTDQRPGSVSLMPAGLDAQLSRQELADLLAFLRNTRWGAN